MSLATLIQRISTIFDDLDQDRFDKDFIQSWIAIENEDVENILESLDLSYDTNVIVLPSVPAQTTDLSQYKAYNGPLQNMMFPVSLEWRLVGQNDTQWNPVPHPDKEIDTNLGASGSAIQSSIAGVASWEWRAGTIYISPPSVAVDLRVRDEELPAALDVDSANYVKGMTNVLAYRVAEKMAMSQGGGVAKLAPAFHAWGEDAFERIQDRFVKEEQTVPRRMGGRRSGSSGPRWRVPRG